MTIILSKPRLLMDLLDNLLKANIMRLACVHVTKQILGLVSFSDLKLHVIMEGLGFRKLATISKSTQGS